MKWTRCAITTRGMTKLPLGREVILPTVDVVIVAFGPEPELPACLTSVLASIGVDVRVALVDNGCTHPELMQLCGDERVLLLQPGSNLGFAAGCNAGAAALEGTYLVLVNSDAFVDPAALSYLVAGLIGDVGLTTGCVLLADQPTTINAAGNPVHFLGVSWAGGWGDPIGDHLQPRDVPSASGAGAALRRELWESLEGFDPALFLYCEDLELSLRVWQRGLRVRFVPDAKVWHHYAFFRNESKWYYLERNRLMVVLTVYSTRTLTILLPALVLLEIASLLAAVLNQRLRAKLLGYHWLLRHQRQVRERRAFVQSQRITSDAALLSLMTGRLDTPALRGPGVALANAVLAPFWQLVARPLLDRRP